MASARAKSAPARRKKDPFDTTDTPFGNSPLDRYVNSCAKKCEHTAQIAAKHLITLEMIVGICQPAMVHFLLTLVL